MPARPDRTAAGLFALEIGGVLVGTLRSVEGGGIKANIIREPAGPDGIIRKFLGPLGYEEINLEASVPLAPELRDWISQTWRGLDSRRDLVIFDCDLSRKVLRTRRCFQCTITSVEFPELDAAAKDVGFVKINFRPELIRVEKGDGSTVSNKIQSPASKQWNRSNFKVTLGKLDGTRVSKIDGFTVKTTEPLPVGQDRFAIASGNAPDFPELKLTMPQSGIDGWEKWAGDFIVQGNNGVDNEQSGSIELLDPTLKNTLMKIDLAGVGIFRIADTRSEANQETVARVEVGLYVEEMKL